LSSKSLLSHLENLEQNKDKFVKAMDNSVQGEAIKILVKEIKKILKDNTTI
jgi:hypothetical protein